MSQGEERTTLGRAQQLEREAGDGHPKPRGLARKQGWMNVLIMEIIDVPNSHWLVDENRGV